MLATALLLAAGGAWLAAPATAATLYPGELIVADASAFGGPCLQGCGGVIAVDPATGRQTALSDNNMAINLDSQLMGAPFTLALAPNGEIIVGETFGLGGSCPNDLTCGGLVEVDPSTGQESLLSSNTMPINAGSQYFGQVNGVTFNQDGQILVSDWGGCTGCGKVIEVNPENGKQTLISSNTMAINADSQFLQYPQGLTVDEAGDIYVADAIAFGRGGGIVEVNPVSGKQTEVSSNELPVNESSQYFTGIGGLVVDPAGDILAADWGGGGAHHGQIIEVDPSTGKESIFSSNSLAVNANSQYFGQPDGITLDQSGNIFVTDEGSWCTLGCGGVIEVDPATGAETEIASNLMAVNQADPLFEQPWDVAVVPSASPPSPGEPVNTTAPAIAGMPGQGQTLTASSGGWNPAPTSITFEWQRSTDGGSTWSSVAGAASSSYEPGGADVGALLRVQVTASNPGGQGSAASAAVGPVTASGAGAPGGGGSPSGGGSSGGGSSGGGSSGGGSSGGGSTSGDPSGGGGGRTPPADSVAPRVSGRAQVGDKLTADPGTWNPTASSYTYRWQRSSDGGLRWTDIRGAHGATFTPTAADEQARLRVQVTARDGDGDTTVTSAATTRVAPRPAKGHRRPRRHDEEPNIRRLV